MSTAEAEQRLHAALENCSPVTKLQSTATDVDTHRHVFEINDHDAAAANMTVTLLGGPRGFIVPPWTLSSRSQGTAVTLHLVGHGLAGHPGIAHGGLTATLADEVAGKAAVAYFQSLATGAEDAQVPTGSLAVTVQLNVSFKAPLPTGTIAVAQASADREQSSARKAIVPYHVWSYKDGQWDDPVLVAEGTGIFVNPLASRKPN